MSGTSGRSLRAVVTMTLSLLIVMSAAPAAMADGGPDRVLPAGGVTTPRPGFGDQILPARPGFGDHIQPAEPGAGVQAAPEAVAETSGQSAGGGVSVALTWSLAGIALVTAAAAWVATIRRRRLRAAV